VLALLALATSALAHDPRPVAVTIAEILPDVYQSSLRVPVTVDADNRPQLSWPEGCRPLQQQAAPGVQSVRCDGGIEGQQLALEYPGFNPSLATFYAFTDRRGVSRTAMVPPTESTWVVPRQPGSSNVAIRYLLLGVEHIIGGFDHLLFVLGLLVIAGTTRRIFWTITGFTLAHSITLSLSVTGVIAVPIVPVEAGIALSILYLAVEIGRDNHHTLTYRYPLIVSFVFGLLHGLGFASALRELGLAAGEMVLSLLFFNIGVEVGQIAFIAAVLAGILIGRRTAQSRLQVLPGFLTGRAEILASYLIGIPSAYWVIDRMSFLY
jgi:hydrogenase/urease accessory protein HupE